MNKVVTVSIFVFAVGYALLTGPFRGADEPNHFFRAFHVSEGGVLAIHGPEGIVGQFLPANLLTLVQVAGALTKIPAIKTSSQELHAAAQVPLNSNHRALINFPNTALYSPLNYFPPAIGIDIGRIFSANLLLLFYSARIFSALFGASLLVFGINLLPSQAQSLRVFAFIPMVLFQTGMVTADTITIALGFICAAEVLRIRFAYEILTRRRRIALLILALILSQLRLPYPMIGLAVLAIPSNRFHDRARARRFFILFFALLIVPCLLWNAAVPALFSQMRPGTVTDPLQQMTLIAHVPSHFLSALGWELGHQALFHFRELLGFLGWRNFPLPWPLIIALTVAITISVCSFEPSAPTLSWRVRIFFLTLAAAGLVATALFIYLMWNEIGIHQVAGFHGRYFLPFLPFVLIALANDSLKKMSSIPMVATVICLAANIVALGLLARATFS